MLLEQAETVLGNVAIAESSPIYLVIKDEMDRATTGLLKKKARYTSDNSTEATLIIGTPQDQSLFRNETITKQLKLIGEEGYIIQNLTNSSKSLTIVANTPVGALYGTFHLLRIIQSERKLENILTIIGSPKITNRILNHWDNLDRTVERGYAGFSIWDWHKLPDFIDQRYIDYARANASIGINGTVLTNVNANSLVLTPRYIEKVKVLADLF